MAADESEKKGHAVGGNIALIALGIAVASAVVPPLIIGTLDPEMLLKGYGLAAAVVTRVSAFLRLLAHPDNKRLDGLGKCVGFSAATLVVCAAVPLFLIDFDGTAAG